MAKPFIKWAGGKTQLLTQFENILPHNLEEAEHFTYIEPFVGGGAMLFHMLQKYTNIGRVIINDINPNLITAYRVIRDTPERLITDLKMLQREFRQNSNEEARKEYFLRIRKSYNEDTHNDVTNTAMFIFLNLNSATVSINRLSDSKLSLWCLGALFDCCISRDKPFHPLTPPSDLRQYAVENRQEIRISQSLY